MITIKRKVTLTVQMDESEYHFLEILSERIAKKEEYIGGDKFTVEHIVEGGDEILAKLFSEVK